MDDIAIVLADKSVVASVPFYDPIRWSWTTTSADSRSGMAILIRVSVLEVDDDRPFVPTGLGKTAPSTCRRCALPLQGWTVMFKQEWLDGLDS